MFESILAYYYALLQEAEKIPDVFRLHRLDTVNYFAPGKPMMELIENQVYLAQGEFPRVIGRSEPLLSGCESSSLRARRAAHPPADGKRL